MLYRQSFEIEQRLDTALRLIRTGRFSAPNLAEQLTVSIPTVSRYVTALRARGHDIRAERKGETWRYLLLIRGASKTSLPNNYTSPVAASADERGRPGDEA